MHRKKRSNFANRAVMLLITGLAVAACSMPDSPIYAERGEEDSKILAVVGSDPITENEVENRVATELVRLEQERYNLIKRGLEQVVADRLIDLEAAKRGIGTDELMAEEVRSKVVEPTQAEIDAFYEERRAQIRQPKEEVADRIRDYLRQSQESELRRELVARLKEQFGYQLLLEPVRSPVAAEGFPAKGPVDAPITIVEFSDFECPYCARINPTLEQVFESYGDQVRLVFRQYPLNIHPNAQKAAEAALCAEEQGRFWEMHDLMFAEQRSLEVEQLKEKATRLDMDSDAFNACLDSDRHAAAVQADIRAGSAVGVSGTPALFINGRFLSGAQPFEELAKVIDEELALQKADS